MKSLIYSVYQNGRAGLSNTIMSIELGVVLAALTDRLLVLKGNVSPMANVVTYGDAVRNTYPSKVTDLMDLGVPWVDADKVSLESFVPHELCNQPVWDCVCYFPPSLSIESNDILSFAGNRETFITIDENLQHVPALAFSGGPRSKTLSFYSYFFYLDGPAQSQACRALSRTVPKPEYALFAKRVADNLGPFNAVHIRRGDFKKTTGVTTLVRKSDEAIRALDQQFSRDERLVILTDESEDPFFDEIKMAFRDHAFIDSHILAEYERDFLDLPAHDSIALAYISQLVAAKSRAFIGSMKSTYSALIQRMKANSGKEELFRFLWNELADPDDKLEPGRHLISDCIRLENGIMIPERDGPYSWNRYNSRLNPAWMREWPEGILNEETMVTRARTRAIAAPKKPDTPVLRVNGAREFTIAFRNSALAVSSNRQDIVDSMRHLFERMVSPYASQAGAEIRLEAIGSELDLLVDGRVVLENRLGSNFLRVFYRQVVCHFIDRHPDYIWLHAGAAASAAGVIVLPGEWARGKSSLVMELVNRGWTFLSDDIAPMDTANGTIVPFPATPQVRFNVDRKLRREEIGGAEKSSYSIDRSQVAETPQQVSMIVFPHYVSDAVSEIVPITAGAAVARLLENSISFTKNEDPTIRRMCVLVERLPVYDLCFGNAADAADMLVNLQESRKRARLDVV